jgi:hypothetical protein
MRGLRYLDFDLTFQRTASGYQARVLGSPAGQAAIDFVLPFSELEIENFLLRFGRSRRPTRRLGSTQVEAARAFGGRLFEAAFQGEIRSCWRSSLEEAQRLDAGLRIRLRLADVPELNDLPWEFLLHPALDRFLALSAETPLVRYLDLPERVRPLAVKPPLEVLAVLSNPADFAQLDVEGEWRKLSSSLAALQERGLLRLRRLESATLPDLQRWLRRETCHVLHFVGHGGFDPRTDDGLMLFADERGRGREVSGQALGTLLHDHRPLRLVVLNACEGARTSRTDPFAGVAQSLVREGIPAVVAMQFEISDLAAIELSHELYSAIVDGYPIDAALGEARKALFFAGHELEWGTPVLYMRSPDGRLFDIDAAGSSGALTPLEIKIWTTPADGPAETPQTATPEPAESPEHATAAAPPLEEPSPESPPADPRPVAVPLAAADGGAATSPAPWIGAWLRRRSLAQWIGLSVLLVAALITVILTWRSVASGQGRRGEHAGAPAPAAVSRPPIPVREAGIYLKARVHEGELIRSAALDIVEGASSHADRPLHLADVLTGCFATDLAPGHKLVWDDIGRCSRRPQKE